MIEGCDELQRPRLAQEARAHRVPVAVGTAPQQADGDRMAERAMGAAEHLAAEPARAEPLAELVGAEQPAGRRQRRACR